MNNSESNLKKPDTNLDDLDALRKEKVGNLLLAWEWVLTDHGKKVKELEKKRDEELRDIHSKLKVLGVPEGELPILPSESGDKSKFLTPEQIKHILSNKMKGIEKCRMHQILDFLGISYARARAFIKTNPDFIQKHGAKKSTFYTLTGNP